MVCCFICQTGPIPAMLLPELMGLVLLWSGLTCYDQENSPVLAVSLEVS